MLQWNDKYSENIVMWILCYLFHRPLQHSIMLQYLNGLNCFCYEFHLCFVDLILFGFITAYPFKCYICKCVLYDIDKCLLYMFFVQGWYTMRSCHIVILICSGHQSDNAEQPKVICWPVWQAHDGWHRAREETAHGVDEASREVEDTAHECQHWTIPVSGISIMSPNSMSPSQCLSNTVSLTQYHPYYVPHSILLKIG